MQRFIDKTKVTCIKWIPGSPNQFLVSHASGQMYLYDEEKPCGQQAPHYQLFKQGEGYSVHYCKTKSSRNPLYRWLVGEGAINEFAFSPCSKYLAVVSQDGYLRVFDYSLMELMGTMKSYFGGLLCVCWSPDGKYVLTGGEDDLVTVWSFQEKRVVCRGQGHKSWVNVVAFDKYLTNVTGTENENGDFMGSDEDFGSQGNHTKSNHTQPTDHSRASTRSNASKASKTSSDSKTPVITSYRFGSVGQDTVLCLWDLTEDILRQPVGRTRTSTVTPNACGLPTRHNSLPSSAPNSITKDGTVGDGTANSHHSSGLANKFATLAVVDRKDSEKKGHNRISLVSRGGDKSLYKSNHAKPMDESLRLLGTSSCPRLDDVPLLEPLVCKKITHERLTSLVFREECLVTACQEGYVFTWARPGKVVSMQNEGTVTIYKKKSKLSPHWALNNTWAMVLRGLGLD